MPLQVLRPAAAALALSGFALLPLAGPAAAGAAAQRGPAPLLVSADPADDATALALAQDRSARADAVVDILKQGVNPAHFADPMPEGYRFSGLEALRADYGDMQRKAAGYRATLGDQHPTLVAAEQVLSELRTQMLDANRKALTAAERDAAAARAAVAGVERRLAARVAAARAEDVTGSIAPTRKPTGEAAQAPGSTGAAPEPAARTGSDEAASVPNAPPRPSATVLSHRLLGAALGVLATLVAAWAVVRLFRGTFPVPSRAKRRIAPAMAGDEAPPAVTPPAPRPAASDARETSAAVSVVPVPQPATPSGGTAAVEPEAAPVARGQAGAARPDGVPVLAALPLTADLAASFAAADDSARDGTEPPDTVRVAGEIHAMLRAAFAPRGRMAVLLAPAGGLPDADADAVALALTLAAAAAGRRPMLMEARPAGRLRRSLVPADAVPVVMEVGGTIRTLYEVEAGGLTVALLPSDLGEAEAARGADGRAGTEHIQGLSFFDTVIMLGDAAGSGALARGADLALLVAPAGAAPADLASAAEPLRAAGRPCGAVLVERGAAAPRSVSAPGAWPAPAPRRRPAGDAAARLGLRGSFEPMRARRGA